MKLIVGLGNPGARYETTRHNAGYLMLDQLCDKFEVGLSSWKGVGDLGRAEVFGQDTLFFRTNSYMNLSGMGVCSVVRFFRIETADLVVIHDDVDVPEMKVKMRFGGSSGGHNGVKDIIEKLGSADFYRIKLGVGKPQVEDYVMNDWVLGRLPDEYLEELGSRMLDGVLTRIKEVWTKGVRSEVQVSE